MPQRVMVIEVGRHGRRPRYHRGAELDNGTRLDPPQCNVDDAGGEVRWLRELPRNLRRPETQLCRRCWYGTRVLAEALEVGRASSQRKEPSAMTEEAERPTFTPAPEEAPPGEADTYEVPEDEEPQSDNTEPAADEDNDEPEPDEAP